METRRTAFRRLGDDLTGKVDMGVLRDYSRGCSLGRIAANNFLSERSVRRRLREACDVFGVETPIEAVVAAVRRGLL